MISNLNAFVQKLERDKRRIKTTATQHVRSQVLRVYKFVLERTPQYSGDLVSNWRLNIGVGSSSAYVPHPNKDEFDGIGGYSAVYTQSEFKSNWMPQLKRARQEVLSVRWNSRIALVNYAPHAYDLTVGAALDGSQKPFAFREVNYTLVKDSAAVLAGQMWNIRMVTLMKFKYLESRTRPAVFP